jgi:Peptidase family M23
MRRLLLTFVTPLLGLVLLAPPARAEWVWPLRGEVITPYRNGTDPYASGQHRGIDIAGEVGTAVVAAAGGQVRFAGTVGSSGLTVSIRTADGRFDTSYLHLASVTVREGDPVGTGDRIGTVGTSGTRSAAAPHLHFGVRDAGTRNAYHDPLDFLPPPTAAPEGPRETPAPQPAPARPAPARPAPSPVEAPAGRRVPVGAPHGRRVPVGAPHGRRIPVGAPHGRRAPVGAPHGRRAPVGAPNGRRVPVGAPNPRRFPVGAPNADRAPLQAPKDRLVRVGAPDSRRVPVRAPKEHTSPAPDGGSEPARPSRALDAHPRVAARSARGPDLTSPAPPVPDVGTSPSRGPDLGLLLACLGLVAAAAVLGFSKDGRTATRATRARLARVLQPLLGRR